MGIAWSYGSPKSKTQFNEVEAMSQFYAKAEDEERCLQSSITRQPIMMVGMTNEGKVASFGGIVQSVENGHREYPGYPVQVTMK